MAIDRRSFLTTAAVVAPALGRRARAQGAAQDTLRVGVLTDLSGSYSDTSGPTSVACA